MVGIGASAGARVAEGTWFTLRVSPYRTSERAIGGAVLELTPTTPVPQDDAASVPGVDRCILSSLPYGLALIDPRLRITYVNQRFLDAFGFGAEVLGTSVDTLWAGHSGHEALWAAAGDLRDRIRI